MSLLNRVRITPSARQLEIGECVGFERYQDVNQEKGRTCWAATMTSSLKTFFEDGPVLLDGKKVTLDLEDPDGPEAHFAKEYHKCVEPEECWNKGVELKDLPKVLEFAALNVSSPRYPPDSLESESKVLEVLKARHILMCLINGGRHVVNVWHACQADDELLRLCVHDPLRKLTGTDKGFGKPLKNCYFFAAGPLEKERR